MNEKRDRESRIMRIRIVAAALTYLAATHAAWAQEGVVGNVLAGELVKPEKGQWAWYLLTDKATDQQYALRIAIVEEEKVGKKKGYWLEIEVVPTLGYGSVYAMLLTGPASDPRNVHRIMVREGRNPVRETPVDPQAAKADKGKNPKRKSLGEEEIQTSGGLVQAEHMQWVANGQATDVWLNDDVRPLGIVRLVSNEGNLMLRNYGKGGPDARSTLYERPAAGGNAPSGDVEVRAHGDIVTEKGDATP